MIDFPFRGFPLRVSMASFWGCHEPPNMSGRLHDLRLLGGWVHMSATYVKKWKCGNMLPISFKHMKRLFWNKKPRNQASLKPRNQKPRNQQSQKPFSFSFQIRESPAPLSTTHRSYHTLPWPSLATTHVGSQMTSKSDNMNLYHFGKAPRIPLAPPWKTSKKKMQQCQEPQNAPPIGAL